MCTSMSHKTDYSDNASDRTLRRVARSEYLIDRKMQARHFSMLDSWSALKMCVECVLRDDALTFPIDV